MTPMRDRFGRFVSSKAKYSELPTPPARDEKGRFVKIDREILLSISNDLRSLADKLDDLASSKVENPPPDKPVEYPLPAVADQPWSRWGSEPQGTLYYSYTHQMNDSNDLRKRQSDLSGVIKFSNYKEGYDAHVWPAVRACLPAQSVEEMMLVREGSWECGTTGWIYFVHANLDDIIRLLDTNHVQCNGIHIFPEGA